MSEQFEQATAAPGETRVVVAPDRPTFTLGRIQTPWGELEISEVHIANGYATVSGALVGLSFDA